MTRWAFTVSLPTHSARMPSGSILHITHLANLTEIIRAGGLWSNNHYLVLDAAVVAAGVPGWAFTHVHAHRILPGATPP